MNLNTHILDKHTYVIYTDGACIGNPGPGGWAAIIFNSEEKKVITGSDEQTTNNRMELIASIKALKIIKTKQKLKFLQTVFDRRYQYLDKKLEIK